MKRGDLVTLYVSHDPSLLGVIVRESEMQDWRPAFLIYWNDCCISSEFTDQLTVIQECESFASNLGGR
jgi:hypothetical protein